VEGFFDGALLGEGWAGGFIVGECYGG